MGKAISTAASALFLIFLFSCVSFAGAQVVFVEAEAFENLGGWVVDQQFMDQMGSAFLLAHGLGRSVEDATGKVELPAAGKYRAWVRTRDWVAPWKAPGAPGKFQLLIDGKALPTTFGIKGADWHWQDGGGCRYRKQTGDHRTARPDRVRRPMRCNYPHDRFGLRPAQRR